MGEDDHVTHALIQLGIFAIAMLAVRAAARRVQREQNDMRLLRDNDQAELFARELPPKPGVVHTTTARVACGDCGELTNVDALEEIEDKRVCGRCFSAANEGAHSYRRAVAGEPRSRG